MTLYDLTQDYIALIEMAEDPECDAEAINDTMDSIAGEFEEKADGYAYVISELKADAEKLDSEIKRLTARKKAITQNSENIKKRLECAMRLTGKTKFKTLTHSFAISKNGGKLPVILKDGITADSLPDYLVKIERTPDMEKIRAGIEIYGDDYAFAFYGERGESLRIK